MATDQKNLPSVLLGRRSDTRKSKSRMSEDVRVSGQGSIVTFAPIGSDRENNIILPNLLDASCSAVVVDPDGEYFKATAELRRSKGHRIVRIDPFGVIAETTDAIDPFVLFNMDGHESSIAALAIANLFFPSERYAERLYLRASELLNAVILYCYTVPEKRSLLEMIKVFSDDDIVYKLAVVLDTIGGKLPRESYASIASWLQLEDRQRSEVLGILQNRLKILNSLSINAWASISLAAPLPQDLFCDDLFTAYLVLPRYTMRSHSILLRIWIGTLLHSLAPPASRKHSGIVLILDECQELQELADLEAALTLRWPQDILIWSIWPSPAQLRTTYPDGWVAIIENCLAIQVLGPISYTLQAEIEALLEAEPSAIASLKQGEQLARVGSELMKLS